jgi:micrococcal nuclease
MENIKNEKESSTMFYQSRKLLYILAIVVLCASFALCADLGTHKVINVIDGDTLKLADLGTVRLIGIDTPETVHPFKPVEFMGKEASEATRKLALDKSVKVETDIQTRDQYRRLLAYIYLPGGMMLNSELVRLGFAQVSTYPPNVKYQSIFLEKQKEAREAKRGLWNNVKQPLAKDPTVYITKTGEKYHRSGCSSLRKSKIAIKKSEAIAQGYTACKRCRP